MTDILYVKKPIPVEAHRWYQNGDHPEDNLGEEIIDPVTGKTFGRVEGAVVSFYRNRRHYQDDIHDTCSRSWKRHGWIKTRDGGHLVCPGDWIITEVDGERYPCNSRIFEKSFEPANKKIPTSLW